ncbi:hypothetical protein CEP53_005550 [Fusarium sp. AF-6]|nr:hypothetical protein CEP53_005550 [Fusarium sp. AF-6]
MSGLEPVAALGLACSIMQTITFTGETISICRKIYNNGRPDPSLNDYSLELSKISWTLKDNLNRGSGVLSSDDLALRDTAEKCLAVTNKLAQEMQNLSPQNGQKGVRNSIQLGFKTLLRKPRLQQLETSLTNIQSAMNTRLLVRTLDRVDASTIEQQDALTDSRRLLQETIRRYSSKNENKLDQIAQGNVETRDQLMQAIHNAQTRMEAHITSESLKNTELVQTHIDAVERSTRVQVGEFQKWKDKQAEEIAYEKLLRSLKFENMEERKNQITDSYPETCRWIFEESNKESDVSDEGYPPSELTAEETDVDDSSVPSCSPSPRFERGKRPWASFVDWLESKDPIYWISGKPGSGKSTLMKFISSNPKTRRLLNKWQPGVQIFSHYFWKAGSEMQNSLKGLLCSLMHQILYQDRQMALDYLYKTRKKPSSTADWDTKKLETILLDCISKWTSGICVFIDGLDEFTPQRDCHDLLFLLNRLLGPRMKLCLSSRPEQILQNHLQGYANLRMQDLTVGDMSKYAAGCLGRAISVISPTDQELRIGILVDRIVRKADGVFLWVVLVSKSLARGIENGDSDPELRQRLDSMPGDLVALYKDMWSRSNDDREIYQKTASWFFNIIFAAEYADEFGNSQTLPCMRHMSVSVFELMAATDPALLDQVLDRSEELSTIEIDRRCSHIAKVVETRSAGLLEVSSEFVVEQALKQGQDISVAYHADMTVRFIHRTARDYLLDSEDGRRLWQTDEICTNEARTRLIRACLLRCHIWEPTWGFGRRNELVSFLKSATCGTDGDGSPPTGLLSVIERTYESGKLWSRPVYEIQEAWFTSQEKPKEAEATFLLWAGLSGLVGYTIDRIPQMQTRGNLGEILGVLLRKFCQSIEDGAAPNFDLRPLDSPWVLYLGTIFNQVLRCKLSMGMNLSYKSSREISQTLRVFVEAGASLLGNIPVVVMLDSPQLNYGCVTACPREIFVSVMAVVLIVNQAWLINEVLDQLDSEANIADIGHERVSPYARIAMAAMLPR